MAAIKPKPSKTKSRNCLKGFEKLSIIKQIEKGKSQTKVAQECNLPLTTVSTIWRTREKVRQKVDKFGVNYKRARIHVNFLKQRKPFYFGSIKYEKMAMRLWEKNPTMRSRMEREKTTQLLKGQKYRLLLPWIMYTN